jgi:hypothetical protein
MCMLVRSRPRDLDQVMQERISSPCRRTGSKISSRARICRAGSRRHSLGVHAARSPLAPVCVEQAADDIPRRTGSNMCSSRAAVHVHVCACMCRIEARRKSRLQGHAAMCSCMFVCMLCMAAVTNHDQGFTYRTGGPNRRPPVTVYRSVSRGNHCLPSKFKFSNQPPSQSVYQSVRTGNRSVRPVNRG